MQNQELTATSIVALFKTTKEQRQSFASQIIEGAIDGLINPLDIHLQLKCMEDIVKQITSNPAFKDAVLDEAQKHSAKSFEYQHAKIEIKEVGSKFDYSKSNDIEYNSLFAESDLISKKLKERESFLKTIPDEGIEIIDKETGEAVTIYKPSKTSTTSVVVTLK